VAEMPRAMTAPQLARHAHQLRRALQLLVMEVEIAKADATPEVASAVANAHAVMRQAHRGMGLRSGIELVQRIEQEAARA